MQFLGIWFLKSINCFQFVPKSS